MNEVVLVNTSGNGNVFQFTAATPHGSLSFVAFAVEVVLNDETRWEPSRNETNMGLYPRE